jgi:hypothetical protein
MQLMVRRQRVSRGVLHAALADLFQTSDGSRPLPKDVYEAIHRAKQRVEVLEERIRQLRGKMRA